MNQHLSLKELLQDLGAKFPNPAESDSNRGKTKGKFSFILSDNSEECKVSDSTGRDIGYVQEIAFYAKVGEPTVAYIKTIFPTLQAELSQDNVTVEKNPT